MGFKFKKGKDKKSKKKKGGKSKDEWTFEGGTGSEPSSTAPKRRASTQERDDRFRRARRSQDMKKRKLEFAEKMSKKVKFSDILSDNQESTNIDTTDNEAQETEADHESDAKPVKISNSIPIADRLYSLVQGKLVTASARLALSRQQSKKHSDSVLPAPDSITNGNIDESKSNKEKECVSYQLNFGHAQLVGEEVEDRDLPPEDGEDSDTEDKKALLAISPSYNWLFNQDIDRYNMIYRLSHKKDYVKKGDSVRGRLEGTLSVNLHPDITKYYEQTAKGMQSIQDIPGLPKLWRSRDLALTPFSQQLLPLLLSYSDMYLEGRDAQNDAIIKETCLMHMLFHVIQARSRVVKHNQRLKKKAQDEKLSKAQEGKNKKKNKKGAGKGEDESPAALVTSDSRSSRSEAKRGEEKVGKDSKGEDDEEEGEEASHGNNQDQGFTRPRLLILCPFRHVAREIVECFLNILGPNTSVANLEKFHNEYDDPEDSSDDDDEGGKGKRKGEKTRKPDDWYEFFKGNNDDDFKMGIQINPGHGKGSGADKGAYVRLLSDFYISDIILASPLGLKLIIDSTIVETSKGGSKVNADFLSSIEQVFVHQADVLYMQNWEHVHYILSLTNLLPSTPHAETDYSRIRPYFLEKQGDKHRQLIMTSYFNHPELLSFYRSYAQSIAGQVVVKKNWEKQQTLSQVALQVKQVYQVLATPKDLLRYEEDKFNYFTQEILASILKKQEKRVLIVIPSYLDYVRVRNYLLQQEAKVVFVCEYSRESEISRGRAWFYHGVKDIMVYSGRAHFFRRFRIRGARRVIFYSLPEYPHFYPEMVNALSSNNPSSKGEEVEDMMGGEDLACLVLTSQLEKMALERVIGPKRAEHLLSSDKSTFVFF